MKYLGVFCGCVVVVSLAAATAAADEPSSSVGGSTLANMGFAGARVMSDAEGLAIRGKGFFHASVWRGKVVGHHRNKIDVCQRSHHGGCSRHLVCGSIGKSFHGGNNVHHGGNGIPAVANFYGGPQLR